jgi:hypothetical protein
MKNTAAAPVNLEIGMDKTTERKRKLEDRLFAEGAMTESPCFRCGYNGPGYYQPSRHPCAERHHRLFRHDAGSENETR